MPDTDTHFSDDEHIATDLKKHVKPLYLTTLYFEPQSQPAARAILSLYGELKKIPETISEPILGDIRTTWWRDMIAANNTATAGSPLAREILRAIETHNLDREMFYTLLDVTSQDLYIDTYQTEEEIDHYHANTSGTLFTLLGALNGAHMPDINKSAGRIYGRAQSLYETPKSLARNKFYWAVETLEKHGLSEKIILERHMNSHIDSFLQSYREDISARLRLLNEEIGKIQPANLAAYAPLALVKPWLNAVRKTRNPLTEIVPISPFSFQWHLWRCGRKGQF